MKQQAAKTITLCDHGQVIDARERFAMKVLADAENRKVQAIRKLWDKTYRSQRDSGDETAHDFLGC